MVFNLKGLMESVRPTQIGIGALETIQDRFGFRLDFDSTYFGETNSTDNNVQWVIITEG